MATTTQPNWVAANHLLTGGLAITSTSTPALNGTYAVVGEFVSTGLQAEINSLLLNANTFVDGGTSVNWPDITGASHTFTETEFRALANAINQFLVACFQYETGITTTAPAATATIP